MTVITSQWGSWAATSISSTSISNTSSAITSAISNSGQSGTEIAITCAYGSGTIAQGVDVYVCRDINGSYEAVTDLPFAFQMPFALSSTFNRTFTVMADRVSQFKILVVNNSGVGASVTVSYKQATITCV